MTDWTKGVGPAKLPGKGPQPGMHRALAAIDQARADAIVTIFSGTRLQPHTLRSVFYAKELRKKAQTAQKNTTAAAKAGVMAATADSREAIRSALMQAVRELFDINQIVELAGIIESAVLEATIDFIADAAPYLGLAKNAKGTALGMFNTATSIVTRVQVGRSEASFLPGDPLAAVKALETLVNREIAFNGATTSREFLSLSAKTAGVAASWGGDVLSPVVGAANAIAGLIQTLTAAAIEFRDMRNGNLVLTGTLDRNIFGKCPILACYFLTCASTSDIINLATSEIGSAGFMDRAEQLRRNIEVSRNKAAKALATSRYVLTRGGEEIRPMARGSSFGPKIRTKETGTQGMSPKQFATMKAKKGIASVKEHAVDMAKTQADRFAHNFSGIVRAGL